MIYRCAVIVMALASVAVGPARRAGAEGMRIWPAERVVVQEGESSTLAFVAVNPSEAPATARLTFAARGASLSSQGAEVALGPREHRLFTTTARLDPASDTGAVTVRVGDARCEVRIVRGIDLTRVVWRRRLTRREEPLDLTLAAPGTDDSAWPELRPPGLWADLGTMWCRARVRIPETWRGRKLRVIAGAIDDNDVAYWNGAAIGRTDGWDRPRDYTVPSDLVKWGEENVLTLRVDNVNAGGGLYKTPILLRVGDGPIAEPAVPAAAAQRRPAPGRIGSPRPLRPLRVSDGVLRYPDGSEVALWGVNIYPQSWHQWDNMKRLGVDMKATVRTDLDHLQRMGVEAIRIHVFDREISDAVGNLKHNEHLDLLRYLVDQCSRRGIYMVLTPIAWWPGPNQRPDAFSAQTSKPGMMFVPEARAAAARYLGQFLTQRNPYSGRALKDEPCLGALEVMNEPTYFVYGDLYAESYVPQGEPPAQLARDRATLRTAWSAWRQSHGLPDNPAMFAVFRYGQMRAYIREMVGAIRATGARQPIAISYFGVNGDDISQAIADSECDAITVSAYPGGWERVNDGSNLAPHAQPQEIPPILATKARLAYEFDTPATNTSCYLYPVLAAAFRRAEVQIATQFQYDSVSTARWNTDWNAHWLNWLYTPGKTVSFMAAGAAFRAWPRGAAPPTGADGVVATPCASSFANNQTLYARDGAVMHARSIGAWRPLPLPKEPREIVGVGNSPWVRYGGTGLYVLRREGPDAWRLTINPDQRLIGNSLAGTMSSPAADLEHNAHLLRLLLPGWERAACKGAGGRVAPRAAGGWVVTPGEWRIDRRPAWSGKTRRSDS